jgi:cellulose synthase (UDP-forming)
MSSGYCIVPVSIGKICDTDSVVLSLDDSTFICVCNVHRGAVIPLAAAVLNNVCQSVPRGDRLRRAKVKGMSVQTKTRDKAEQLRSRNTVTAPAIEEHQLSRRSKGISSTTIATMTIEQRQAYRVITAGWFVLQFLFWTWWLGPMYVLTLSGLLLTIAVVGITLLRPAYFLYFLGRMRHVDPALQPPPGLRVTFATTYVPSAESIEILERTVTAMCRQEGYPHDVWVLDEGDTPEVRELCARVGAHVFSRKKIARYQSPVWPFKRKTKAGNYNAWLDWLAEQEIHYDILIQMDTDHVPQPGYLVEMIRPFADPNLAYVAAPSISMGNRSESWVVSARYQMEALSCPVQMGYNAGFAPMICGSHAAFRLSSLYHIGGFQQTLAEDHHNTLRLNAEGFYGVFNPDATAIGQAPSSFADIMVQERQWARAATQLFWSFFPTDCFKLSPGKRVQFAFIENWYPIVSSTAFVIWILPIIALIAQRPWAHVAFSGYLAFQAVITVWHLKVAAWVKGNGWYRPKDIGPLSWQVLLLELTRWPHVLLGVFEAAVGRFTGRDFAFSVTPKGSRTGKPLPLHILTPYFVIIGGSLAAVAQHLIRAGPADVTHYMIIAIVTATLHIVALAAVIILNARETISQTANTGSGLPWGTHLIPGLAALVSIAALLIVLALMLSMNP